MSGISSEWFRNLTKALGIDKKTERPAAAATFSRKRRAEEIDFVPKQPRLGLYSYSKIFPLFSRDDSKRINLSRDKPFKTSYPHSGLSRGMSNFNHFNSEYAINEYSDDEDEQVMLVPDEEIAPASYRFSNSTGTIPKILNGNSRRSTDGALSKQTQTLANVRRHTAKSPPPPMLPLNRGAAMLSRVPGLTPIRSNRSYTTAVDNDGRLVFRNTTRQSNPPQNGNILNKFSESKKSLNSVLAKRFNMEERQMYQDLLKTQTASSYNYAGVSESPHFAKSPLTLSKSPIITIDDNDDVVERTPNRRMSSSKVSSASSLRDGSKVPEVEPVNSLKSKFSLMTVYHEKFLNSLLQKFKDKADQRKLDITEQSEGLKDLTSYSKRNELEIRKKLQEFSITPDIITIEGDEEEEDEFPELTQEDKKFVQFATLGGSQQEVIVEKFNLRITRGDLQTIIGDSWLNDEVINFYMNLLMERSEKKNADCLPKVYAMNTFFIPRLMQSGHAGVRRWTRKVDIFSFDVIPVPVHVGQVHWCMAIIHLRDKTIRYYDSMGSPNPRVLQALEGYLREESLDKKKVELDMRKFVIESVRDVPKQMNGSDCGVFSCMFAEYISRDKDITFSQQHMPYFRQKMIFEIARGKLLL